MSKTRKFILSVIIVTAIFLPIILVLCIGCEDAVEKKMFNIGDTVAIKGKKWPPKTGIIHRITKEKYDTGKTYLLYHIKIYHEKMHGYVVSRQCRRHAEDNFGPKVNHV